MIKPNIDLDSEDWKPRTRRIVAWLLLAVGLVAVILGLGVAGDNQTPIVPPAGTAPAGPTSSIGPKL